MIGSSLPDGWFGAEQPLIYSIMSGWFEADYGFFGSSRISRFTESTGSIPSP